MRKGIGFWFILSILAGACAYSGNIVPAPMNETGSTPGARSGYAPYRNDSKADRRKDDALRKIAKYCGSDGYTVTSEVPSAQEVQVNFRCTSGAVAAATPAPAIAVAPAPSSAAAVATPAPAQTGGSSGNPPAQN